MVRQVKPCILSLLLLALWGCANSVVVETAINVPQPLVNALPLSAGVYFPEATRNHIYSETSRDGRDWSIKTGASQTALFDHILRAMFTSSEAIESWEVETQNYDVIIVPTLKDIQFSLPRETGLEFFEVWMEYELSVIQSDGKPISVFPLIGYGRSPKDFLNREKEGIRNAANLAFRDVGANLIVEFQQNPQIKTWLSSQSALSGGR